MLNNPSSNTGSTAGTPPANASSFGGLNPQRMALDNLIRRELKVGDPTDSHQVAQALLERYKADPRAGAISMEARGLPFLQTSVYTPQAPTWSGSSGAEWKQACDDIERDLASLSGDAILKDITPELRGWGQAIRNCLDEGFGASRMALDVHNRDKGFAMRRSLNDYARLARLIGAHTPIMNSSYRALAKSLDEASNLLLVMMGEALANLGFGGGRYLPHVRCTEMQIRRDAAIYALRTLVGSTQQAYGPEEWPRGLDAYRQLTDLLEAQGHSDLRSLLVEGELARTMDELVQRGADTTSEGLRAVGSTALLGLERFRRLVAIARRGISPESPSLYAFLEALQLFASSFDSARGFRLMKIARPPILFYGLYGSTGMDDADRRLIDMITRRGQVADRLDCIADGACCMPAAKPWVVLLDKTLYDIDRAIDLYALGAINFGQTERRAAGYGYVIDAVLAAAPTAPTIDSIDGDHSLRGHLEVIATADLRPLIAQGSDVPYYAAIDRLRAAADSVLATMTNEGLSDTQGLTAARDALKNLLAVLPLVLIPVQALVNVHRALGLTVRKVLEPAGFTVEPDLETDGYLGVLEQEVCLQGEAESRWKILVHSMVPNCGDIDRTLAALEGVVASAVNSMTGVPCETPAPIDLPPTIETSLDTLVERVERTGLNRPNRVIALHRGP
jgi:hypothetical protein